MACLLSHLPNLAALYSDPPPKTSANSWNLTVDQYKSVAVYEQLEYMVYDVFVKEVASCECWGLGRKRGGGVKSGVGAEW